MKPWQSMKHVRHEEGAYTLDTGDMPNWMHDPEPLVKIEDDPTRNYVFVPIRLLREFLALYDEAQAQAVQTEKDGKQ